MDISAMAYQDTFIISGKEFKGKRNMRSSEVLIPCTNKPAINIGDTFSQKGSQSDIALKVIDLSFSKGGTLDVGTPHHDMLTLKVENTTASEHTKAPPSPIHVGSISAHQVQVGHGNAQTINITVKELAEKIAASNNEGAKGLFRQILENPTFASIIGAGAPALLALLK
jgi:hypothetical protein